MRCSRRLLVGLGVAFGAAALLMVQPLAAGEIGSGIIERLGKVVPTPVPSPEPEQKIRLIASMTLQNKPTGASTITFEAADYGEKKNGRFRVIAIEQYSLIEPKPEARELRDRIVAKVRDLEQDLLDYVELVGPPRAPQRIFESGGASNY